MRTLGLWLGLVAYFVIGYSIAPRQRLMSPQAFSNGVLGLGFVFAMVGIVWRRRNRPTATPNQEGTSDTE